MQSLYRRDLAYIHASAFEKLALGAAAEIIRRLKNSKASIRRVLDVGCGAGPLSHALVTAGYEVTGLDVSAELLELARERVPGTNFVQASAYEVLFEGYDAVLAVGEPLTYHERSEIADHLVFSFFENAGKALPAGGILIFDVIGIGEPPLAGRTWMAGEDWAVLLETTEDQPGRSLVRNIETFRRDGEKYRRGHEVHRVQLFDIGELKSQLLRCDFDVEVSTSYGELKLPPRRFAIFATRR